MGNKIFRILAITLGLGILALGLIAYSLVNMECSFDEQYARERVVLQLVKKGLRPENLSLLSADTEVCFYLYTYKDGDNHIDYSVIDDYIHGPKLGWWDHNERSQE